MQREKDSYSILFYIFHGFFENKSGIIRPDRKVMGDVGAESSWQSISIFKAMDYFEIRDVEFHPG
jgi:hypothetical protein